MHLKIPIIAMGPLQLQKLKQILAGEVVFAGDIFSR